MKTNATFRIARQTGGFSLFARVGVSVDPAGSGVGLSLDVDVPAMWSDAALLGSRTAVTAIASPRRVTITEVSGLMVDTTCVAVAAAAYFATMEALGRAGPEPQAVADWCRSLALAMDEPPSAEQLRSLETLMGDQ